MTTVRVFAPAKINLTLHITGQQPDGYHTLDSLVAFAPVGDHLVIQPGNTLSLTVEGPEAEGVPADMDNLALRAAALAAQGRGAALTLEKRLPVASGIGGGSADAAAAYRGMLVFSEDGETPAETAWAMPDIVIETHARALKALGADVPMCLMPKTLRARGIGEEIQFASLPALPAVLVNPRVGIATPAVFKRLAARDNPPMPEVLPTFADAAALIEWLGAQRNDLEAPAMEIAPEIGTVLDRLRAEPEARLVRMSGSGATCFALFTDVEAAQSALGRIRREHPNWWIAGGLLGDQLSRAMPKVC